MTKYLVILYLVVCVAIGAVGDGLMDEGVKLWGHGLNAFETALLISGAFVFGLNRKQWIPFILAYIFFRVVLFDYSYNLARGLPWDYIGFTSAWDLWLRKIPPHGILFGRFIFLSVAVSLPVKYIK